MKFGASILALSLPAAAFAGIAGIAGVLDNSAEAGKLQVSTFVVVENRSTLLARRPKGLES